jgi:prepilin-type N-terminal cleavage/methylation domain-containing protein/prepilin-type processing-associated H-X9-DG protein
MRRLGFTLIELLVVIAIIAILIALIIPAVQKVRDTAARMQCQNNLKQIGLALHSHHDNYKRFPAGISVPVGGASGAIDPSECPRCQDPPVPDQWGSWLTMILPYMEQTTLYQQLNLGVREYGYCAGPDSPGATVVPGYICPSDYVPSQTIQYATYYFGVNSYFANAGTKAWPVASASLNGVMYYNSAVRIDHISDGAANTLLAGERYSYDPDLADADLAGVRGWAWTNANSGEDHLGDTSNVLNARAAAIGKDARKNNFGSGHAGGANFILCDGSVRFLSDKSSTNLVNWQRLAVPDDGQAVVLED